MYAYVGGDPVNGTDPTGESAMEVAIPIAMGISQLDTPLPGPADVIAGAIIGCALLYDTLPSDKELQKAIEKKANYREYKSICDKKPPPGLEGCERAKWKLKQALKCKDARGANTKKWWGGKDKRHNPQLHDDIDNRINNAKKLVERMCCKKCR